MRKIAQLDILTYMVCKKQHHLLIGLAFGLSGVQPVPAIILAQAINGAFLPIVAIFLILVVNDPQVLPKKYLNSHFLNILMLLIVGITGFLGMNNFPKALLSLTI